jgi:hypothetical protein
VWIPQDLEVGWHWCHLIGASLLPIARAQHKSNIILVTSAANGQMECIERALRWYIRQYQATLSVEVTVTYLIGTPFGTRLRYQIHDRQTDHTYREYFDLYGHSKAATLEAAAMALALQKALHRKRARGSRRLPAG